MLAIDCLSLIVAIYSQIRVAYGASVVDAMLFDEIAQEFIGANATRLQTVRFMSTTHAMPSDFYATEC